MWPNECPLFRRQGETDREFIARSTNDGVEHTTIERLHFQQASACWDDASNVLRVARLSSEEAKLFKEIIHENIAAVKSDRMFPYSYKPTLLASDISQSFYLYPDDVLHLPDTYVDSVRSDISPSSPPAHPRSPSTPSPQAVKEALWVGHDGKIIRSSPQKRGKA